MDGDLAAPASDEADESADVLSVAMQEFGKIIGTRDDVGDSNLMAESLAAVIRKLRKPADESVSDLFGDKIALDELLASVAADV